MGLRINTNVQSLLAQRALRVNKDSQDKSMERLSSGNRINRAGDDAAGLAISEKLKADIRSMKQASRNANDGISLIQVAEGGMTEVGSILSRMRELSIQGSSDTIGDRERLVLDKEVQALKSEIKRIASGIEFNGTKLLNGTSPNFEIQIGVRNNASEDRFVIDSKNLSTSLESLGVTEINTETKEASRENLDKVDNAINILSSNRAELGALQNRLYSTVNNLSIYRENLEAANSRIRDTDMADETSELTKANILSQATISVLSQANQSSLQALKLLN